MAALALLLPGSAFGHRHVIVKAHGHVRGTRRADVILTRAGATIHGGPGHDHILGGLPTRGGRRSRVRGGRGADFVVTAGGNDRLIGGPGADTLNPGFGNDRLIGGAGADDLHGGVGYDRIRAGPGNDHVTGSSDHDLIWGGSGMDALTGGPGADAVWGGAGDDVLHLYMGNDRGYGGPGWDVIGGYSGNDLLDGGPGTDLGSDWLGRNAERSIELHPPVWPKQTIHGHPFYNPPDDRIIHHLPHLDGRRAHILRRTILHLRKFDQIHSIRHLYCERHDLGANAMIQLLHRHHGLRSRGLAYLKLQRLYQALAAEVDRLTVIFNRGRIDHGLPVFDPTNARC